MQKEVKIKTSDKKVVYGTLDEAKRPKGLVVFVHGLGGHQNEHIFFNAAKYFTIKGYSTFRFDLYNWNKNARNLEETTIKIQSQDLDRVFNHFKSHYKKVFVVGHSIGGPTILISQTSQQADGIILWDPTYNVRALPPDIPFVKKYKAYILDFGISIIFNPKMWEEYKSFPKGKDLIKKINKPIKIISAGKNKGLAESCKDYYKYANQPKSLAIIKNAGHNFDEEGTEEELFKETYAWVKKFS